MKGKLIDALGKIERDKLLHILIGLIICQLSIKIYGFFMIHWVAVTIGLITAILFGIVKEVIDNKEEGNRFDEKDLHASIIGALIGAILII